MKTDDLREAYLAFFESKGCVRRPSDVLVPTWDKSVLFTPAGMNQFKDHFLGRCKLEFTRATTCQKCLRTGDIDNVGRTAYHHTFFEMLGNFSFGDYFKREAILWAWEFLTSKKWLAISPERLSVSVYQADDEAAGIWSREVYLPPEKIRRMGEDDNFWPAGAPTNGPDGVCGPCSEIFFHPPTGGEVEIWNLVFTQFNRVGPPPNNLRPLPSKNIDTGMGLERTAATLQGVESNFHIDILRPIVEAAADVCGLKYDPHSDHGRRLRRITDHIRACTFAVHENVYPGPKEEKYVIRRLLRRAVLDGHHMGRKEPFLFLLVPIVVEMMKHPYPELLETAERVAKVIQQEEANFLQTIDEGLDKIERLFAELEKSGQRIVPGKEVFFMFDTHGFPPELFEQIAKERGLLLDWDEYRAILEGRKKREQVDVFASGPLDQIKEAVKRTEFLGYQATEAVGRVVGIVDENCRCDAVADCSGQRQITVVLDRTPFYGEAGGQVGDQGELTGDSLRFEVQDTQRYGELILHLGRLRQGRLAVGQSVTAKVHAPRRQGIRRAHSATHVLHYALQKHLGRHAQQQGSKVDDDWLRFDFTSLEAAGDHLESIQAEVLEKIRAAAPVSWSIVPLAEARQAGAMMLFGEKYPDPVRMVTMGDFSRELCGGTHLDNTREIGDFEILAEESISAGVRRITAVTGAKAQQHVRQTMAAVEQAAQRLGIVPQQLADRVASLSKEVRELRKQLTSGGKPAAAAPQPAAAPPAAPLDRQTARRILERCARQLNVSALDVPRRVEALLAEAQSLRQQLSASQGAGAINAQSLLHKATDVAGVRVIVSDVPIANPNQLRQLIDQLRKTASPVAVLLAGAADDKVTIVAGMSHELVARGGDAGRWVREVAAIVEGGGGGKPDMAQAGGKSPHKLPQALEKARQLAAEMLT